MNIHSYNNDEAVSDMKPRGKQTTVKRREQILKAAIEIFSSKGYAAATIPEIARLAGVASGTIYIYYSSKRELFIDVIKNIIITTPLFEFIDRIPQENIDIILKNILKDRFELIKNTPVSWIPSLIGEIQRDPELKTLWAEQFIQPFLTRIEEIYRFMTDSERFGRMEPAVAVRAVGGMILGFFMLRIMEGELSPLNVLDQEKVIDDIVNLLLHGLLRGKDEEL
jgi:AcrR family transcriptional regulator